jgi:hypothetical protein
VRRSGVLVSYALIRALGLDRIENRLEFPDGAHVVPDVQEILGRIRRELFLEGSLVGIHRDIR